MATDAKVLATKRAARQASTKKSVLTADAARLQLQELLLPKWGHIVDMATQQAIEGNSDARQWLSDRAFGRAPQAIDISGTIEHTYSGQVNVAVLTAELTQRLKGDKMA